MSNRTANSSNTIAFRAKDELLKKLDSDCRRLGISRGELVRAIVSLHYDTQPEALRDDLDKLLTKVRLIHKNQARTLVSLLTAIGRVPLEDAKQVARTDLLN